MHVFPIHWENMFYGIVAEFALRVYQVAVYLEKTNVIACTVRRHTCEPRWLSTAKRSIETKGRGNLM